MQSQQFPAEYLSPTLALIRDLYDSSESSNYLWKR